MESTVDGTGVKLSSKTRALTPQFTISQPNPLDIPRLDEKVGRYLPAQDRGWPAWSVLIAATIEISCVSGTDPRSGSFASI